MYQHIVRESGLVYAFVACPNERPMHSVRELLTEVQSKQKIPPAKLCAALHLRIERRRRDMQQEPLRECALVGE